MFGRQLPAGGQTPEASMGNHGRFRFIVAVVDKKLSDFFAFQGVDLLFQLVDLLLVFIDIIIA
jgi:hypothetical protein